MCGRFAQYLPLPDYLAPFTEHVKPETLARLRAADAGPRYNVAPGTFCWVAAIGDVGTLRVDALRWNFPTSRGNRINVRSESAHRVAEYRTPFDHRRCVVFASGFYEPEGPKTTKNRPWYFFSSPGEGPLFLGGIVGDSGFSILTRTPAPPVALVHDRSPVLIPTEGVLAWLHAETSGRDALARIPATAGNHLEYWRVGDGAKRAASEGPQLIERV